LQKYSVSTVLLFFFFVALTCSYSSAATNRYLGVSGTDTGSCTTASHPCRTFHYVDSHASAGDVVHVLPGTYYLASSTCIVTNTAHVTWQSDVHGAATINGGGHCKYMWHNSGTTGYLRILGFQFTGVQVNGSLNSFGLLLEGSEGNFEVVCSAKTSYNMRRHTFPAGIHDANRPRCPQLRSDNREAIDVSGAAAKGVASAQEFLDLGSNVGVLYYNELPMTAGFHVVVVRGAGS